MENNEIKKQWHDLNLNLAVNEKEIQRLRNEQRNIFLQYVSLYAQAKQSHDISLDEDHILELPLGYIESFFYKSCISKFHLNDEWEVETATITSKIYKTQTLNVSIEAISGSKIDWWLYAGELQDIIAREFPVVF